MTKLQDLSDLWENPENYLIVVNSDIFPDLDSGMIFDRRTRYCFGFEDDALNSSVIRRMREAGVESIESRDFHSEPTDATKIIENGFAAGLAVQQINQRLKELRKR
jgi:hypothetical protein